MAKLGINYFPDEKEIVGIVKNNLKSVKADDGVRIDYNADPYKLFLDHKKSLVGIGNFVVSGTMSERAADKVAKFEKGQINRDALLYNPVELYRLANEVNYTINAEGSPLERLKAFKPLNFEMEVLAKWGANLEEVKVDLLLDNFLSFNNIDENHIFADFNEYLVDNALETYGTLCKYDRFSPYTRLYKIFKDYVNEPNPDLLLRKEMIFNSEVAKYDPNMIRTYAYDKIVCEILKCVMQLRYATNRDRYLDGFSGVEERKSDVAYLGFKPIYRRQFDEDFVKDIYNLATLKEGGISLNQLMKLYMSLMDSVHKQFPDISLRQWNEEFSTLLTFFNTVSKKTRNNEITPNNQHNSIDLEDER